MSPVKLVVLVMSKAMLSLSFRVIPSCACYSCILCLCAYCAFMRRRAVSCASRVFVLSRKDEEEGIREDDQVTGVDTVGDSQLWVYSVWSTELQRAPRRSCELPERRLIVGRSFRLSLSLSKETPFPLITFLTIAQHPVSRER